MLSPLHLTVSLFLLTSSVALADPIGFDYDFDEQNATLSYTLRIYEGNGPYGTPILSIIGSTGMAGNLTGTVFTTGDAATQIQLDGMTANTTAPLYTDTYIEGLHVELLVEELGIIYWPDPVTTVNSLGDFYYYQKSSYDPNTKITATLADFIEYDVSVSPYPDYEYIPLYGNVAMIGDEPRIDLSMASTGWIYVGDSVPEMDYTVWGRLELTLSVPEPASLVLLALPLMTVLRRRAR
ncbi:MAG: PEP-CTERM sorting domain-containing protein [Phycisphaerae bacterium]|nr:PEP-CTERM sorting domain-containing protein [Phycisphaerae bacterium]